MRIVSVILLLAGIGLSGLGAYAYFFSEDQKRCQSFRSEALELSEQARAAEGTPKGAALAEDARAASGAADVACANAKQTHQSVLLFGLGAFIAIVLSALIMLISLKRSRLEA